jgi:ubiquinone biosynthesis protein
MRARLEAKLGAFPTSGSPERLRIALESLGPTFVKLGQLLAARQDLLPESFTEELSNLQDNVNPIDFSEIERILAEDLTSGDAALLSSCALIDPSPLAAASIAQVHRATLQDGTKVVFKVQRPHLQEVINCDLEILKGLATLVEHKLPALRQCSPRLVIDELSRSLKRELRFDRELRSMELFRSQHAHQPHFCVPTTFPHLSSPRVLCLEYIEGVRIDRAHSGLRPAKALFQTLCSVMTSSLLEHRFYHSDPHPGNMLVTRDGTLYLLDFGSMGRVTPQRVIGIIRLFKAIFSQNGDSLLLALRDDFSLPIVVDDATLRYQVEDVIQSYSDVSVAQLDLRSLFVDLFEVMRKADVSIPSDLLMVIRVLTTLHGIGLSLDPALSLPSTFQPILRRLYRRTFLNPRNRAATLTHWSADYRALLRAFPTSLQRILTQLSQGRFHHVARNPDIRESSEILARAINRIIVSLLGLSFFFVGIVILLIGTIGTPFGYTALGISGIILLILVRAVLRSGGL